MLWYGGEDKKGEIGRGMLGWEGNARLGGEGQRVEVGNLFGR